MLLKTVHTNLKSLQFKVEKIDFDKVRVVHLKKVSDLVDKNELNRFY